MIAMPMLLLTPGVHKAAHVLVVTFAIPGIEAVDVYEYVQNTEI